ncbi:MAG: helix-turn-helix domain-containing protein [Sciscionella sp.]
MKSTSATTAQDVVRDRPRPGANQTGAGSPDTHQRAREMHSMTDIDNHAHLRGSLRTQALRHAIQKRATGVPTYSVPEAAALLSISQEYLYRLIQAGGFPAVRMRIGGRQGRYVVPAKAVEELLDTATHSSGCLDADEWSQQWHARTSGGVA